MHGLDPYHPTNWHVTPSNSTGVYVVSVRFGYQVFQCAVYATSEDAQAAVDACRSFVNDWKDKPAPADKLPSFQFPPNDKVTNFLPFVQRSLKHDGH